jgi:hypothetical protein
LAVSWLLLGCFLAASWLLLGCFLAASWLLLVCFLADITKRNLIRMDYEMGKNYPNGRNEKYFQNSAISVLLFYKGLFRRSQ